MKKINNYHLERNARSKTKLKQFNFLEYPFDLEKRKKKKKDNGERDVGSERVGIGKENGNFFCL